jgi:hypothetical protein
MPQTLITDSNPGTASWSNFIDVVAIRSYTNITIVAGNDETNLAASGLFGRPVLITLQGSAPDATLTSIVYEWINTPGDIVKITGNANATADVVMTVIIFDSLIPF